LGAKVDEKIKLARKKHIHLYIGLMMMCPTAKIVPKILEIPQFGSKFYHVISVNFWVAAHGSKLSSPWRRHLPRHSATK
jgi:hypothetical protein